MRQNMAPSELISTVKLILESVENQNKVESDFHQALQAIGTKKNNNGTHTSDGLATTANKIHTKLKQMGYERDTTLGEYNKQVGKTFHVVKLKGNTITQRFL